jgi:DNA-binding transcriptional LysR family regulator
LEIFVRVVDTGSFSAVARQRGIGQPAVSKAVAQLEAWLGVSLLLRSTRSVLPTEAGRAFYERAKRTVEEADEAVTAARGSASGLTGKLRVSTSVCFGKLHVIPRLSAFLDEHPELEIELVLDDRHVDLVNGGAAWSSPARPIFSATGRPLRPASSAGTRPSSIRATPVGTPGPFAGERRRCPWCSRGG